MSMPRLQPLRVVLNIGICLAGTVTAAADWPPDLAVNVPICTAPGDQAQFSRTIATDGEGGAIIVWDDHRDGTADVYAQRIDSDGVVRWAVNGIVAGDTAGTYTTLRAVSDGSGGAIIAWLDAGGADSDIRAQRVSAAGQIQWPLGAPSTNGIPVCTADGDQYELSLASDEAGGAYIAWRDDRDMPSLPPKIYAQRVDSGGQIQWTLDGLRVAPTAGGQINPAIARDGSGGTIIAWADGRDAPTSLMDIYAQRLDTSGTQQWSPLGVPVCTHDYGQDSPAIVGDGSGGAIIAWVDHRGVASGTVEDVYAGRVTAAGATVWAVDGIPICDEPYAQTALTIASDGAGGAVVAWEDDRGAATTSTDIFAQRVDALGSTLWGLDGNPVCTALDLQFGPDIASVGPTKWIVTWSDWRGDGGVYAQRLNGDGVREGPHNGLPVTTNASYQEFPVVVATADNEAIVAWSDLRTYPATGIDVYAQGKFFGVFHDGFESGDTLAWSVTVP